VKDDPVRKTILVDLQLNLVKFSVHFGYQLLRAAHQTLERIRRTSRAGRSFHDRRRQSSRQADARFRWNSIQRLLQLLHVLAPPVLGVIRIRSRFHVCARLEHGVGAGTRFSGPHRLPRGPRALDDEARRSKMRDGLPTCDVIHAEALKVESGDIRKLLGFGAEESVEGHGEGFLGGDLGFSFPAIAASEGVDADGFFGRKTSELLARPHDALIDVVLLRSMEDLQSLLDGGECGLTHGIAEAEEGIESFGGLGEGNDVQAIAVLFWRDGARWWRWESKHSLEYGRGFGQNGLVNTEVNAIAAPKNNVGRRVFEEWGRGRHPERVKSTKSKERIAMKIRNP